MTDLTFNINKFDLVYKDVERLSIRPISAPFYINGELSISILIRLIREGYEINEVESKNINIPFSLLTLFAKFQEGIADENDVAIVNGFIGQINPQIVVDANNPVYVYESPVVEDAPPLNPPVIEEGEIIEEE